MTKFPAFHSLSLRLHSPLEDNIGNGSRLRSLQGKAYYGYCITRRRMHDIFGEWEQSNNYVLPPKKIIFVCTCTVGSAQCCGACSMTLLLEDNLALDKCMAFLASGSNLTW